MSSRGKKKKDEKLEKESMLENALNPDYVQFESPFKNVPQDKIHDIMKLVGEKSDEEFLAIFEGLRKFLQGFDVVDLVTWFTYYTLADSLPDISKIREEGKILQFHVELLQALLLQNDYSEDWEWKPVIPENVNEVERLILRLIESYHLRKLKDLAGYEDEEETGKMLYIDSMRNHTMAVRNWGYPEHVIRISKKMFSKIDYEMKYTLGISPVSLLEMFERIVRRIEEKQKKHVIKVQKLIKCNDKAQMIKVYKENWPQMKSSEDSLMEISRQFPSKKDFQNSLLCHSDMFIREIFSFTIEEFQREYPDTIEREKLANFLDGFAFSYGELRDHNSEYFFLGNPVWTKPLIIYEEGLYIWPIPGLLFHSCITMIEQLFSDDIKLKEKYEKGRAEFLEEAIESEFIKGFPQAKIFRGSSWVDDIENKEYENDLLILVDSYAIAVEAKSGKITDPAKRGATERLKKDIEKLIVDPSIQASRFSKYLERNCGNVVTLKDRMGKSIQVNLAETKKVLTCSITLDLFGPGGTNLVKAYKAGFIKQRDDLSPCVTLADLEVITDLLPTSCEKIHYFSRRYEIEKNAKFIADELDLLVFYLETGFNIGESESDGSELSLYGVSSKLDYFYLHRYHTPAHDVAKPRPRRTKWWNSIINNLESRKIPRWTESSYMLLSVSFEDQHNFEKMFLEVVDVVEARWYIQTHINSVVLFNSYKRNDAIIVYVYKNIDKMTRDGIIKKLVAQAFDGEERCKRALVIGVNLNDVTYPYNVLAVFDRKEHKSVSA